MEVANNVKDNTNLPGVSLIVPIYNAENTLKKCLDSILSQDYRNLEIVLVDDGSVDASSSIIDSYAGKYYGVRNIKTIHKTNAGLMKARLTGLKSVSYDLITFVDADDWIENNHISTMMLSMIENDADLIIEGCIQHENGKIDIRTNRFPVGVYQLSEIQTSIYPKMLCYETFFSFGLLPFMWNKVFKKEILMECYKTLDTDIYDGEDVLTFFSYILKVNRLVIGEAHSYHYCLSNSSMTKNVKPDFLYNVSKLYSCLYKVFSKNQYFDVLKLQLDQYMRMMVKKGAQEKYIDDMIFFFPFKKVPVNKKVILYGAGYVGKNYAHQITKTGYCELVAWVDKNYERIGKFDEVEVVGIDAVSSTDFDYIVIAIEDNKGSEKVKNYLMTEYKIKSDKIII